MSVETRKDLGSVAVVIPCYRSSCSIRSVVRNVPAEVGLIVCVDDASDDHLHEVLRSIAASDPRVRIISHEKNEGVGAATISGYRIALAESARIIVKIDSDGQMNPRFIPSLVAPIIAGEADYVKGNRFFDIDQVRAMPRLRLIGNACLSFIAKLSTGYWDLLDPTNGFTAIHADVAALIPLNKLHKRYFFESDLLFRLRTFSARVVEQPIETRYSGETSHLNELDALITFPLLHARNFLKRIAYNYFLRGFDVASLSLVSGLALVMFGLGFGIHAWAESARTQVPATTGTVMLVATPLLIGFQLLLAFLQHDVAMTPRAAIHRNLSYYKVLKTPDFSSPGSAP
jgi:dolichol-phosphate mannosyltransferase